MATSRVGDEVDTQMSRLQRHDSDELPYAQTLWQSDDSNQSEDDVLESQVFGSGIHGRDTSRPRVLRELQKSKTETCHACCSFRSRDDHECICSEDSSDPEDYDDGEDEYNLLPDARHTTMVRLETLNLSSGEEEDVILNCTATTGNDDRDRVVPGDNPSDPSSSDESDTSDDDNGDRGPPRPPDDPDDPDDEGDDGDEADPFNDTDSDEEHWNMDNHDNMAQAHLLEMLADGLASLRASTQVGHYVAERIYDFMVEYKGVLQLIRRFPKSYKTLRRRSDKKLPPIHIKFKIKDLENDEIIEVEGEKFDRTTYGDPMRFKVVESWTTVSLADALTCMDSWHNRYPTVDELPQWRDPEQDPVQIDLSWDGVEADKKKDKVLEVLSMRSIDCNRVVALSK